jgi:hypothetical protein
MREEQFDMIVMRGADETGKLVTAEDEAQHLRRDPAHLADLKEPPFGLVANAADAAFHRGRYLRHWGDPRM